MLKQQAISRSISSKLGLLRNEAGAVGWIELAVVTVGLLGAGVIYFTSVAPKMAVFDREASAAMAYQAAQAVSAKVALVDGTGNLRVADPATVRTELNKVAKLLRSNADQDDFCAAAYRLSNCSASGCITDQVDSAVSDGNQQEFCTYAPPTTPEVQMALNARGNQAGQADRYAVLAYSPTLTDRSGRPSFAVYGASFRAISSAAPGGVPSDTTETTGTTNGCNGDPNAIPDPNNPGQCICSSGSSQGGPGTLCLAPFGGDPDGDSSTLDCTVTPDDPACTPDGSGEQLGCGGDPNAVPDGAGGCMCAPGYSSGFGGICLAPMGGGG